MRRLTVAFLLLVLLGLPTAAAAAPPPPAATMLSAAAGLPIEPALLKLTLTDPGPALHFIVEMRGQAALDDLPLAPGGLASAAEAQSARRARTAAVVARLRDTAAATQAPLLADLAARQASGVVQSYTPLWVTNAVAVTAGADTLLAVAARPEVRLVRLDRWRQWVPEITGSQDLAAPAGTPEWNIQRVRADATWAALGLDGSGVVVGSVDTGVDWQHPALAAAYRGQLPGAPAVHMGNWFDATDGGYLYPGDGLGHGTHTMGTMVGAGGIGVAPGARWISAKAFNSQGFAYDSWIHAALQWTLAPAGDPALAPDLVNNSWGSADSAATTFAPDLQALAAAGILAIFSAGNEGPREGSVSSPASLPGVLSVGAVDSTDLIAAFSGRGPSPWNEVKPALTAPGVNIRSSTPGGAYQNWQGTSMAAPHVSGAAAILLQARPGLDITGTVFALTSTAVPLLKAVTDTVPNDTYGWGRLDVLAAAQSVASTGALSGTVTGTGGAPLPGARVDAWGEVSGLHASVTAGSDGGYALPLAAGPYTVTAAAFGFYPSVPVRDIIITGTVTRRDIALSPMPTGTLQGHVLDAASGSPLTATVAISGTPISVPTDPATGRYEVALPAGEYALRVEAWGHRLGREAGVAVTAGSVVTADFALAAGPDVLVVDSGAWYNDPHGAAYASGLEELGYLHGSRPITDLAMLPALDELERYDLVLWSAPQDSPGMIRADGVLSTYLALSGRLLVSGQDVAYWDGGGSGSTFSPFMPRFLHAAYVADDSGSASLAGLSGDVFSGISLTLNTADSDRNQASPDVVEATDDHAAAVLAYGGGGAGGLRADVCLPYRVLYLSFGLEGAGPRSSRNAALEQAITWLMSSRPAHEFTVTPASQTRIGAAATTVTGTVRIWNTGTADDAYTVTLGTSAWPGRLTDETFAAPLPVGIPVSTCHAITAGVAVTIPYDVPRDQAQTVAVTVDSAGESAASRAVSVTAKTPASLLLVDDDRWYDVQGAYTTTLAALNRGYDVWDISAETSWPPVTPGAGDLALYPAVVWFTGYDWAQPLTPGDEAALGAYLNGGGRLFLSSQDYLYVSGLTSFGAGYLGVLSYTNDITAVTETGWPGSPIGGGLGPYTPTTVYHMWPDVVTPTVAALPAFLNPDGNATSLSLDAGGFRSVFFTFPFEGLPASGRTEVLRRILDWFGPLRASTFAVDRAVAQPGALLSYALTVENPGETEATVWVTNTLPAALELSPGSLHGATYDPGGRTVTWSGVVPAGGRHAIDYATELADGFRGLLANQAVISSAGGAFAVTARTVVPYQYYLPLVTRP